MAREILGLNKSEIEVSQEKYGRNVLEKEKTKGFLKRFLENLISF